MKEMKIAITMDDSSGFEGEVCSHFGQCSHFFIVETDGKNIKTSKVVPNKAQHGGGGCQAVSEVLKYGITHIIAGGMGVKAKEKFEKANVPVFQYAGKVKDAIQALLNGTLEEIETCRHEHHHH